jgi:hypothetical protein
VKYTLLIYTDEQGWTEAERQLCYGESTDLAQELKAKGQYVAASRSSPFRRQPACGFVKANALLPTGLSPKLANNSAASS